MKSLIWILLLAVSGFAGNPPKIVSLADNGKFEKKIGEPTLEVNAFRIYGLESYPDKVRWRVEPVYEIGYDKNGKPVLITGAVARVNLTKDVSIPNRETETIIDVKAGGVCVWGKTPGKVRLIALGLVDGFPDVIDEKVIEIIGSNTGPQPPPIGGDKPVTSKYIAIVRKNGPVSRDVEQCLSLPAWTTLAAQGIVYRDIQLKDLPVSGNGNPIPEGTELPCVLVLDIVNGESRVVPPPRSLPKNDAEVMSLIGK